jgi:Cof subfamily protein (haloacid dehalogenase superfamily)
MQLLYHALEARLFSFYNTRMDSTLKKPVLLIATDLDGTLLNPQGRVSSASLSVLRQIHARGIRIVIASGRPVFSARDRLPADLIDYVAGLNGQVIWKAADGSTQEMPKLSRAECLQLFALASRHLILLNYHDSNVNLCAVSRRHLLFAHVFRLLQRSRWIFRQVRYRRQTVTTDFASVCPETAAKLCFAGSFRSLQKLDRELDCTRWQGVFVSRNWYEVQRRGISKGEALKKILEQEGIPADQCAAFGDGENDISLLQAAGTGVAVANAMVKTREAADEICLSSARDGVARWLQERILQNQ